MVESKKQSKAYLVESIPLGLREDLRHDVPLTAEALRELIDASTETIDLTAMYWNLEPTPKERRLFTEKELENLGVMEGQLLFDALYRAAEREVHIRILEGTLEKPEPGAVTESQVLKDKFPEFVDIRVPDLDAWFGGGIMHQKIWIFDSRAIYLGSANMDWKSLTQVKELGVVVEDDATVAGEFTNYFEAWWEFSAPGRDIEKLTAKAFDPEARIERKVPVWSALLPEASRRPDQAPKSGTDHDWDDPLQLESNGKCGDLVISGAPAELCVGKRVFDGDALVKTILEAEETVCVNVMDFAPVSIYSGGRPAPVWWPALFDALLHVVTTKQVRARLLVSKWPHSSPFLLPYLQALEAAAVAGGADRGMVPGTLEIRRFMVPGFDQTRSRLDEEGKHVPAGSKYPDHTRVNHTKYIVTEKRVNIGTSNMTWDYFAGTAGSSFNTTHPDLVAGAQQLFDRDWEFVGRPVK